MLVEVTLSLKFVFLCVHLFGDLSFLFEDNKTGFKQASGQNLENAIYQPDCCLFELNAPDKIHCSC